MKKGSLAPFRALVLFAAAVAPLAIAPVLLTLAFTAVSNAAVHHVPSELATIQAGIDASAEGDTVLVAPGSYTGPGNRNLHFNGPDCVVISEAGSAATIIDCQNTDDPGGLWFTGSMPGTVFGGFTFQRLYAYDTAVYCYEGADPELRDLIIADCVYGGFDGIGGLLCWNSSPRLTDVLFLRNIAEWVGGMAVLGESAPTLMRVNFEGNQSIGENVGGLLWSSDHPLTLSDVAFTDNRGTGLTVYTDSQAILTRLQFIGNSGEECGGLKAYGNVLIQDCVFYDNEADGDYRSGGAILCGGSISISGCTITHNSSLIQGSGICFRNLQSATIENTICTFNGNSEGVYWTGEGVPPAFECCDVFGHAAGNYSESIGDQTGINGNISAHPLYCWGDELEGSFFELHANSPCLPENNDCNVLMGAYGEGCVATGVPAGATETTSWGELKARY